MSNSVNELKNSQYKWEISTDGGTTFNQVNFLTEMDMPKPAKVLDDVTSTDDTTQINAVVNFTETNEIAFKLVYMPTDTEHQTVKSAYENTSSIVSRISFIEAPTEGYQFDSMVKEFNLVPEQKKMLRVEGVLVISSEITSA